MPPGPVKIYAKAKFSIGAGQITLGAGIFKLSLHRASASAAIMRLSTRSTFASIPGEISARGGYVAGGRNLVPATGYWVVGASAKQYKFTWTANGLAFTAVLSAFNNIKYALIRNSTAPGAGQVLCFCTLSTGPFSISPGNTFTIIPPSVGVFRL
jgi:hypothetical protein